MRWNTRLSPSLACARQPPRQRGPRRVRRAKHPPKKNNNNNKIIHSGESPHVTLHPRDRREHASAAPLLRNLPLPPVRIQLRREIHVAGPPPLGVRLYRRLPCHPQPHRRRAPVRLSHPRPGGRRGRRPDHHRGRLPPQGRAAHLLRGAGIRGGQAGAPLAPRHHHQRTGMEGLPLPRGGLGPLRRPPLQRPAQPHQQIQQGAPRRGIHPPDGGKR